jgi:hypothetical protein
MNDSISQRTIVAVLMLVLIVSAIYFFSTKVGNSLETQDSSPPAETETEVSPKPGEGEQVFCTLDAKQCPDGSYVGRVPPNCEFEACPGEGNQLQETENQQPENSGETQTDLIDVQISY